MARSISAHGISLLEAREGVRLTGYLDSRHLPTIGVGHLIQDGEPYTVGGKITQAECDRLFAQDLHPCEDAINSAVKVPITQNQFDAMVSFAFNIGIRAFKGSSVVKALNRGDVQGAADAFMKWVKPVEITGRRRSEMKQFLTPDPTFHPAPVPIIDPPPAEDPQPEQKPDKPPPDPQVIVQQKASAWSKVWTGVCAFFSFLWTTITGWYATDFAKPLIDRARDNATSNLTADLLPTIGLLLGTVLVIGAIGILFLWLGVWVWNHEKARVAALNAKLADIASDTKKATVAFTNDPAKATANLIGGTNVS